MLALTHDLFCDFFAAEAVRLRQRTLPEAVTEPMEEVAVLLAEQGELGPAEAKAVAANPVAATRCAAAEPLIAAVDDEDATALLSALPFKLAEPQPAACISGHGGCKTSSTSLHCPGASYRPGRNWTWMRLPMRQSVSSNSAPGTSSLRAAVAVWRAGLRAAVANVHEGTLQPIPAERDALPEALVTAFLERAHEFQTLCQARSHAR